MHHALEGCYLELTNKQSDLHSERSHALTVHFMYSEFIMSIFLDIMNFYQVWETKKVKEGDLCGYSGRLGSLLDRDVLCWRKMTNKALKVDYSSSLGQLLILEKHPQVDVLPMAKGRMHESMWAGMVKGFETSYFKYILEAQLGVHSALRFFWGGL